MKRRVAPVITTDELAAAVEAARISLEGDIPEREPDFTPKHGWFNVTEYCAATGRDYQHIRRAVQKRVREGIYESKQVYGLDVGRRKRVAMTVYRELKKETPNAKVDRLRRSVL
jgi:hypothetical protein